MTSDVQLYDPEGRLRASLRLPASPESLLRAGLGLTPADRFVICWNSEMKWSLGVLMAGGSGTPLPIGPKVNRLPQQARALTLMTLIETAWQGLLDSDWSILLPGDTVGGVVPLGVRLTPKR